MNRRSAMIRTLALAFAIASATLPTPPVRASVIVKPTGEPITLDVSKGIIIRLDRPCSSVFVADPDIADVQLKSPTVLYIMGKGAGETTIYAVDQQDRGRLSLEFSGGDFFVRGMIKECGPTALVASRT